MANNITEKEKRLLEKLRETLDNSNIDPRDYSLCDGDFENTVCLNKENGKWLLYTYERGQRGFVSEYYLLSEAIVDFIPSVAPIIVEHVK